MIVYKVLHSISTESLEEVLNRHSNMGWEACSITPASNKYDSYTVVLETEKVFDPVSNFLEERANEQKEEKEDEEEREEREREAVVNRMEGGHMSHVRPGNDKGGRRTSKKVIHPKRNKRNATS